MTNTEKTIQDVICLFENAPMVGKEFGTRLIECSNRQADEIVGVLKWLKSQCGACQDGRKD